MKSMSRCKIVKGSSRWILVTNISPTKIDHHKCVQKFTGGKYNKSVLSMCVFGEDCWGWALCYIIIVYPVKSFPTDTYCAKRPKMNKLNQWHSTIPATPTPVCGKPYPFTKVCLTQCTQFFPSLQWFYIRVWLHAKAWVLVSTSVSILASTSGGRGSFAAVRMSPARSSPPSSPGLLSDSTVLKSFFLLMLTPDSFTKPDYPTRNYFNRRFVISGRNQYFFFWQIE